MNEYVITYVSNINTKAVTPKIIVVRNTQVLNFQTVIIN